MFLSTVPIDVVGEVMVLLAQQQQIVRMVPATLAAQDRMMDVEPTFALHVPAVAHPMGDTPPITVVYGRDDLMRHRACPTSLGLDR